MSSADRETMAGDGAQPAHAILRVRFGVFGPARLNLEEGARRAESARSCTRRRRLFVVESGIVTADLPSPLTTW
jgi:hypothetical protein